MKNKKSIPLNFKLRHYPGSSDEEDFEGERTVNFLERAKFSAELLCSNKPKSVGLHPGIYCYSWTGKHQPILFLTIADIIISLARKRG